MNYLFSCWRDYQPTEEEEEEEESWSSLTANRSLESRVVGRRRTETLSRLLSFVNLLLIEQI